MKRLQSLNRCIFPGAHPKPADVRIISVAELPRTMNNGFNRFSRRKLLVRFSHPIVFAIQVEPPGASKKFVLRIKLKRYQSTKTVHFNLNPSPPR
jgi:hypothetical protein